MDSHRRCVRGQGPQARPLGRATKSSVRATRGRFWSPVGAINKGSSRSASARATAIWSLRIAWPLFVLNVVGEFAAEDASYLSSFRTGEVWHVPVPTASTEVRLRAPRSPEASAHPSRRRARRVPGARRWVLHDETGPAGAVVKSEFAANLADAEESAITPKPELWSTASPRGPPLGFISGFAAMVGRVALLALALSSLEWADFPSEDHGMNRASGTCSRGLWCSYSARGARGPLPALRVELPEATWPGLRGETTYVLRSPSSWGSPCSPRSFS